VLRSAAGEPAQDLLGLGGAEAQGGGVLHDLVVLLGDQVPVDRLGGEHGAQVRPVVVLPGRRPVQLRGADVLQPGHQLEVEHVREGEPDDGGAVVSVYCLSTSMSVQCRSTPSIIEATSEAEQDLSWE